jgi:hypothetical protein
MKKSQALKQKLSTQVQAQSKAQGAPARAEVKAVRYA